MLRRDFNALFQILLNAPREEPSYRVDVDLVNVLCTVRDKDGRYVRDLRQDEVEIRDEGVAQEIRHFTREVDTPLTIALLIDVSGSVAAAVSDERDAAQRFLTEVMRRDDRGMVAGFWSAVTVWQDFTASPEILGDAIEREVHASPQVPASFGAQLRGGTLLHDAVNLVAAQKLKGRTGRKVMVLITDGIDQGSYVTSQEAARAAQEADAILYGIHFHGNASFPKEGFGALRSLCEPTGGQVFKIERDVTLTRIFALLAEEMRSQYAIAYKRPENSAAGEFRRIRMKIRRAGLKHYTRAGYFTPRGR